MENIRTRLFRNSTINFIGWIIPLAATFLAVPLFIRIISPAGYGVWVLVSSLTGYFSLFQLGIGPAIIKYVAEFKAQDDLNKAQDTINAALLFSLIVGLIGGVAIYSSAPLLVRLFHLPAHLQIPSLISFRISGVFFPALLVSNVYVSAFVGFQRYSLSNTLNIIQTVLTTLIGVLLLLMGYGIVGLVTASAVVDLVSIILGHYLLYKKIGFHGFRILETVWALKKMFGYSIYTFISQLSQALNARLAEIIIGITLGPTAVTYFNVPARLVGLFSSGASSLSAVIFPFASELQTRANFLQVRQAFLKSTRYFTFLIVPIYTVLIVFSKPILTWWLSAEIAGEAHLAMSLYAAAYLVANMTTIPSQFLQGFGRVRFISQFSVGIILVSIITYYPLIRYLGLTGAGVSVLLTQIVAVGFIYYSLRIFEVSLRDYLSSNITPFAVGLLALIPLLLLQSPAFDYIRGGDTFLLFASIFLVFYLSLCLLFSDIGPVMGEYFNLFVRRKV